MDKPRLIYKFAEAKKRKVKTITDFYHSPKQVSKKQVYIAAETEHYLYESLFKDFIKIISRLKSDRDKVNNKPREYLTSVSMLPAYQKAFGEHALVQTALRYRIRKIRPQDFEDDFIILADELRACREPKYYINRLNIKLLKLIYLPQPPGELQQLIDYTLIYEKGMKPDSEIDPEEEDEDMFDYEIDLY